MVGVYVLTKVGFCNIYRLIKGFDMKKNANVLSLEAHGKFLTRIENMLQRFFVGNISINRKLEKTEQKAMALDVDEMRTLFGAAYGDVVYYNFDANKLCYRTGWRHQNVGEAKSYYDIWLDSFDYLSLETLFEFDKNEQRHLLKKKYKEEKKLIGNGNNIQIVAYAIFPVSSLYHNKGVCINEKSKNFIKEVINSNSELLAGVKIVRNLNTGKIECLGWNNNYPKSSKILKNILMSMHKELTR